MRILASIPFVVKPIITANVAMMRVMAILDEGIVIQQIQHLLNNGCKKKGERVFHAEEVGAEGRHREGQRGAEL